MSRPLCVDPFDMHLPDKRAPRIVPPLQPNATPRPKVLRPAVVENILERIALRHECRVSEIVGPTQDRKVMQARRACAAALRERGYSLTRIGLMLNRDHASIIYMLRKRGESFKGYDPRTADADVSGEWAI